MQSNPTTSAVTVAQSHTEPILHPPPPPELAAGAS